MGLPSGWIVSPQMHVLSTSPPEHRFVPPIRVLQYGPSQCVDCQAPNACISDLGPMASRFASRFVCYSVGLPSGWIVRPQMHVFAIWAPGTDLASRFVCYSMGFPSGCIVRPQMHVFAILAPGTDFVSRFVCYSMGLPSGCIIRPKIDVFPILAPGTDFASRFVCYSMGVPE